MSVSEGASESLWDVLGEIPDRRGAKGRRYSLRSVPVLTLAAMLSGANDLRAVYRWGRRLPEDALSALGMDRAPRHAMYHYFFRALDVDAAERVPGSWACGSDAPEHVALDGKRLRGSAPAGHDGRKGVHLMSAFAGRLDAVIGQMRVSPEGNEATAALALLKGLPLKGAVVTGDAAFANAPCARPFATGAGTICSPSRRTGRD